MVKLTELALILGQGYVITSTYNYDIQLYWHIKFGAWMSNYISEFYMDLIMALSWNLKKI